MDLMSLSAVLTLDSKDYEQGIKKAQSSGNQLAANLEKSFKRVKTALGAALSVAAIKKGVDAVMNLANTTAQAADRIDKQSQALGISRKAFQQWDYILSQSGASIDSLGTSMKTLNSAILGGSDSAVEAFDALGLQWESLAGMTQEGAFETVVDAFQKMPQGARKSALAIQLFGKNGQTLMPLLNTSSEAMDDLRKNTERLGFVMSDSMIDAGVKFGDTLDDLKRVGEGLSNTFGYALLEPLTGIIEEIIKFATSDGVQLAVDQLAVDLRNMGDVVLDGVQGFFSWLNENGETLSGYISNIAKFLGDVWNVISGFAVETVTELAGAFSDFLSSASPEQIAALAGLAIVLGMLFAPVQTLAAVALTLAANWEKVKEWAGKAKEALNEWTSDKLEQAKEGMQSLADKLAPVEEKFDKVREGVKTAKEKIGEFFETGEIPDDTPEWLKSPLEKVKTAWDGITGAVTAVKEGILAFFSGELDIQLPEWVTTVLDAIRDAWGGISSAVGWVKDAIKNFFEEVVPTLPEWVQTVLYAIRDAWDFITTAAETALSGATSFFTSVFGEPSWLSVLNSIIGTFSSIVSIIDSAIGRLQEFFATAGSVDAAGNLRSDNTFDVHSSTNMGDIQRSYELWNANGFASGIDYVHNNGLRAVLHEGEAVLNKRDATAWRSGGQQISASSIASAVRSALEGVNVVMDKEIVGRLTAKTVSREIERNARAGRFVLA